MYQLLVANTPSPEGADMWGIYAQAAAPTRHICLEDNVRQHGGSIDIAIGQNGIFCGECCGVGEHGGKSSAGSDVSPSINAAQLLPAASHPPASLPPAFQQPAAS